jgi:hypothetical protein
VDRGRSPLAGDVRLEAVLLFAEHGFLERTMGDQQRGQARCLEHDPALQANRRITGVHATTHAVLRKHDVEASQQFVASHLDAIERHRLAPQEAQRGLHRI